MGLMEQNKYWQNFGERNQSEAYQVKLNDEFSEELPVESADDKGLLDAKTPRRDFLKYLGFSTAAAAIAASCETPIKKAIPFVNKPEDITPGVANYYATTFVQNGDVVSVLAKVRDGRPIKIEGNELSPITQGGTSASVQASVLDLYDTSRLRFPIADGKEVSTYEAFDKMIADGLVGLNGAPVVLLTGSETSPTTKEVIKQFLSKVPNSRQVVYDAISYNGMLLANEACYGKKTIPSYQFDQAKVVVSLAADFLGTWVSPIEFSKQYAKGRKINESNPEMSRHFQFESMMSMTGANADFRYHHRPSETASVALALLAACGGSASAPSLDAKLSEGIKKAAKELLENKGNALVVCGSNDTNVQVIINAINELVGANGSTINWSTTYNTFQGVDSEVEKLVSDMNAGSVGALVVCGVNPAYNYSNATKFSEGIKKVKLTVSFNEKLDETTALCKYVAPSHHYLESWGDAEHKTGFYSLLQPTIHPLFKTRQWQDSLLEWSDSAVDYLETLKGFWSAKVGGVSGWDKALQDGVITPIASSVSATSFNNASVATAVATASSIKKSEGTEMVLYQKITMGFGAQANNPWLQETPDPITKGTWDNYAMISPALAKSMFGIDLSKSTDVDSYEVHPEKPVVKITANNKTFELPIIIVPGTNPNTIAVALGYGVGADNDATKEAIAKAQQNVGMAAAGVGKNVFGLTASTNGRAYSVQNVIVEKTEKKFPVGQNQTHSTYDGRTEVVLEASLASLKSNPKMFIHKREHLVEDYASKTGDYEKEATIYPYFEKPGIKWGMSIDMNTCTGCTACVVACNAENNIPVVGKVEVMRGHEMHWMRIDRYYSGDMENPNVIFQPMICQHCDNAPCENVCPVAATNHSTEGLNQMTYNRCIGTRYCANNCPYKVRRFNWADYTGSDSFPNNQVGHISDATMMMNDDLTRMVLNPDVTVRSRGVIEKCSFCVQRLQDAKLTAKKASRPMVDSDLKVACQQACPTNAIVFGNVNDKESAVSKARVDNNGRLFYSLEMLHVLPNVSYMAKIRNTDEVEHANHSTETKKEEKHS
jgi:MoCo/4Fe-4S cofactor protein with predicted Tat translocation signal